MTEIKIDEENKVEIDTEEEELSPCCDAPIVNSRCWDCKEAL